MSGSCSRPAARFSRRFMPPLKVATRSLRAIGEADERRAPTRSPASSARAASGRRARRRSAGSRAPTARRRARGPAAPGRSGASSDRCRRRGARRRSSTSPLIRRRPARRSSTPSSSCRRRSGRAGRPAARARPQNDTSSTATSGPNDLRRCLMSSMVKTIGSSHVRAARRGFPTEGRLRWTKGTDWVRRVSGPESDPRLTLQVCPTRQA